MKKLILVIFLFFIIINSCYASVDTAYEYILMDSNTGRILAGKNYNTRALIASITKIMTCILAIESNKLDRIVVVDDTIKDAYGSGIYIEIGEEIRLRDLLYGLMLRSGNDAALMVAKYVSGDVNSFVKLMNGKAKSIGMTRTTFVNPSGLDDDGGNYSTAYDMALLTRYAMNNKIYREIVKTKSYTVKTNKKTYVWKNKNKLLSLKYITGGKTGYTDKARRTLVSTATSDNINLVVVTIRDSDDWNTHKSLYNYIFDNYFSYKVLNKGYFDIVGDKYYNGRFYLKNDIYIPIKDNETNKLVKNIRLKKLTKYNSGDNVGFYDIYLDDKLLYSEKIYIKVNKKKINNLFEVSKYA